MRLLPGIVIIQRHDDDLIAFVRDHDARLGIRQYLLDKARQILLRIFQTNGSHYRLQISHLFYYGNPFKPTAKKNVRGPWVPVWAPVVGTALQSHPTAAFTAGPGQSQSPPRPNLRGFIS